MCCNMNLTERGSLMDTGNYKDYKIFFEDPAGGYTLDIKTPEHEVLHDVAEKAITLSGVTDRLTIIYCEDPDGKFKEIWLQDPEHLSYATAIELDTIFVCLEAVKRWAYFFPHEYEKFMQNNNLKDKKEINKHVLIYIEMILVEEIKRFAGDLYH